MLLVGVPLLEAVGAAVGREFSCGRMPLAAGLLLLSYALGVWAAVGPDEPDDEEPGRYAGTWLGRLIGAGCLLALLLLIFRGPICDLLFDGASLGEAVFHGVLVVMNVTAVIVPVAWDQWLKNR